MPLLTYGINHKTAPVAVRERWSFNTEETTRALHEFKSFSSVNEAVLLSTCNRTEVYTVIENQAVLEQWIQHRLPSARLDLTPYRYTYQGIEAVQHMMRVASGLDSMVLGEAQILGQIKKAYQLACDAGTVGAHLQHVFPAIFSVCKSIRHETTIGHNPVSIAYVIIQQAKHIFSSLKKCRVLLIGAGDIIELVATHLHQQNIDSILIASRHLDSAATLAEPFGAHPIRIGDIPSYIRDVDIIISATASQLPILGKGMIESALKRKKHRPLLMVDLAVPRDIEPEVEQLDDVYLYNIDDLQHIIEQNVKHREDAAKQAEAMIALQAEHYLRQRRVMQSGDVITRYRQYITQLRDQAYQDALAQLRRGETPENTLRNLAHNLTNKVMHGPTTRLRKAAYENDMDTLLLAKKLFGA